MTSQGRWVSPTSADRDLGLLLPGEIAALRRHGTVRTVETGTLVASSGSTPDHVQVVASGELELLARLPTGRATMAVVRAGGVIADIPVLLAAPMPYDAVARRESELVSLSKERWTALLGSSPTLAVRWMTSIARRLDDDRRRLVVLTSRPLVAQVAYLLLELAEPGPTGLREVRLSHTTLAHLLGARRQSVTRVLAQLRTQGMVQTRYGGLVLHDEQALADVMGPDPLP